MLAAERAWPPVALQALPGSVVHLIVGPAKDDILERTVGNAIGRSYAAVPHWSWIHGLRTRHEHLTRREREVFELVVQGRPNKKVASALGISEITVKAHRGNIMRKMRAGSLPELVTMAARLGIEVAGSRPSTEADGVTSAHVLPGAGASRTDAPRLSKSLEVDVTRS